MGLTSGMQNGFSNYLLFFRNKKEILNECSGHLLRTKPSDSDEGGVASGFSCLDSPAFV